MRTSTLMVSIPPSRMKSRSWITRSSVACVSIGTLPISSKKMLPLSARSNMPFFGYTAPVNAPLTCPNSVDSSRSGGRLPELTVTNERSDREEFAWIALATSSLPLPRAAADDVRELVIPLLNVLPQVAVLVHQPPPLHRVADDHEHFVVLERLGHV